MVKKKNGKLTVAFDYEKSTKGAHRFQEDCPPEDRVIGTLYIRKSAMEEAPKSLKVVIETVK